VEICAENISHTFNLGTPLETKALEKVSFTLPNGSALGVLGGTGSGKTTLVKHLNGLLAPTEGRLLLDGEDIRSYPGSPGRAVGLVLQRPERQLFEETVMADISFVLRRFSMLSEDDILAKVSETCEMLGLDIGLIGQRSPLELSDGEKRKVAIAGILVNEPHILVLDEPAVGLDPPSVEGLVRALDTIKNGQGRSLVIVSHDMEPFLPLLDRVLVLTGGRVAAFGSPADVCAVLGDDPVMRDFLPGLALLVHDLRQQGIALQPNEFRIQAIVDQLTGIASPEEGSA
jgi:energy-coupling factor transport system ATP-binding protein